MGIFFRSLSLQEVKKLLAAYRDRLEGFIEKKPIRVGQKIRARRPSTSEVIPNETSQVNRRRRILKWVFKDASETTCESFQLRKILVMSNE